MLDDTYCFEARVENVLIRRDVVIRHKSPDVIQEAMKEIFRCMSTTPIVNYRLQTTGILRPKSPFSQKFPYIIIFPKTRHVATACFESSKNISLDYLIEGVRDCRPVGT